MTTRYNPTTGYYYILEDVNKSSGEGSRGGKVTGHTSSGKAIYTHENVPDFHYTEHPNLTRYRRLVQHPTHGTMFQGRLHYDKKQNQIVDSSGEIKPLAQAAVQNQQKKN